MASGTAKPQFFDEIKKLSTFQDYEEDDFTTARDEKKQRDKQAALEARRIEEEQRKAEEERIKQIEADAKWAREMEEQEYLSLNTKKQHSKGRGRKGIGRGKIIQEYPEIYVPPPMREAQHSRPARGTYFFKEAALRNRLTEVNGMESYYNNNFVRQYWQPQQPSEQADLDEVPGIEFNDPSPDLYESCRSSSSASAGSSQPYISASPSISPLPPVPVPVSPPPSPPRPSRAARTRGSRLAARFSNLAVEDDEPEKEKSVDEPKFNGEFYTDVFTSADHQPVLSSGHRYQGRPRGGMSLNDLRPSHRIIGDGLLGPDAFLRTNLFETPDDTFTLKQEEFPPLQ